MLKFIGKRLIMLIPVLLGISFIIFAIMSFSPGDPVRMKLGDGAKLELMTKPEIVDTPKDPNRTGFVHICIKVDSREKLDEVVERFHKEGFHIFYEPATTGGHEVRAVTFEDLILEVGC